MALKLNDRYLNSFVAEHELTGIAPAVKAAHDQLVNRNGLGSDFLGWIDLPVDYDKEEFARIKQAAAKIKKDSDVLIVIGIGGSYLGARAVIEAIKSSLYNSLKKDTPDIYFIGNSISPTYLSEVVSLVEGKDFSVNIISKSGTTTEPALAFRVFRDLLVEKYGEDGAKGRIYATTDKAKGTLKELSDKKGYETFVVPDDVGGRFSVLTAVGLLPIACAGCDIDALMKGAADARAAYADCDLQKNDCYKYAALRNILYRKGKSVEMLIAYEPSFAMMNEWYKQLFGESEGKEGQGVFPASVEFTADLHSMGQYIQEGSRNLFETVVRFTVPQSSCLLDPTPGDGSGLDYLRGRDLRFVNEQARRGTALAHTAGGVPNLLLTAGERTPYWAGQLVYFFEYACGLSGYLSGVNPFDQPGVEAYKHNMFALLGKPGYEAQRKAFLDQMEE